MEKETEKTYQENFENNSQNENFESEDLELKKVKYEYDTIVVLHANEYQLSEIKENWPYKDLSFDDWIENGSLVTSDGLPSKLNEHQYKQVRTSRFKEFFGDWQNDKDNSSKIINSVTGEPMVLYRGDGTRYRDEYVVKVDEIRDKETKNDQGIFFTNSLEVAQSYANDISGNLGVYGKDYEADHPETFEETKRYVLSIIKSDKSFWYKVFVSHLPNYEQYRGDINSVNPNDAFKAERLFKEELSQVLKPDLVDSILDSVKTHGLRNSVDADAVLEGYVKAGLFEKILGFAKTYLHGGDQSLGLERVLSKIHNDSETLNYNVSRNFKMEPRIVKSVFINARSIHRIQMNTSQSGPEIAKARNSGYDAAIGVGAVGGGLADEYIVFNSKNIKSATENNGLFEPDSGLLNN